MKDVDVILSVEFLEDFPKLRFPTIKIYIYLRKLRELSRDSYPDRFAWVRCGQDTLLENTGLKSLSSVRVGLLELAELGYIADYRRGGYNPIGENTTNKYLLPDKKLKTPNPKLIKKFGGDVTLPPEEIKTPAYVKGMHELRKENT